jgi:hypothetical protein
LANAVVLNRMAIVFAAAPFAGRGIGQAALQNPALMRLRRSNEAEHANDNVLYAYTTAANPWAADLGHDRCPRFPMARMNPVATRREGLN